MPQGNAIRRAAASSPSSSGAASPKRTRAEEVQMHKVDICWQANFTLPFTNPAEQVNVNIGSADWRRFAMDSTDEKTVSVSGLTNGGSDRDITCKVQLKQDRALGPGIGSIYHETVFSLGLEGTFFSDDGKYGGNITVTVYIVDEHGEVLSDVGIAHITTGGQGNGGEYDEVKFSRRLPPFQQLWDEKEKYYPGGVLRVKYKLTFLCTTPIQDLLCISKAMATLSHDLGKLLREGMDTADFVIKCGETEFQVHQLILRARSPVFASMLAAPMREMEERKVAVEDVEPEIMKAVLEYIYSSVFQPDLYEADQLIAIALAAEKYELTELKDTCLDYMVNDMQNMEPSVLGRLVGLVHLVSAAGFKNQVLKYCADNFSSLSQAEGFVSEVRNIPTNLLQQFEFVTAYNV